MVSPENVVRKLLEGVVERRWNELADLYSEPTDVRHPLHPDDVALRSRVDLREHFESRSAAVAARFDFQPENLAIHLTLDPELVIAEFEYRGAVRASGMRFAAPCIFVVRVRAGRIVKSRDYVDQTAFRRVAEAGR
jgi:ketosteroid isomerase-like protein